MNGLLSEFIKILSESAIYLVLGFALAGAMHALLLRREGLLRPIAAPGYRSVLWAALIGAPIPLCSCGVLPAGLTLMRRGASKGATAAFLITTPETDVVSILLTYGLIGPVMMIARPVAALVTGISAGFAINAATATPTPIAPAIPADDACCDTCGEEPLAPSKPRGWLGDAVHFGFVEFFDDLIGRLLFGLVLGAAIAVVFGRFDLASVAGNRVLGYVAMLLIGVPLYVCASASTPIAAGLIIAGVSPGAALIFLLGGPATNVASLMVIAKQFGRLAFAIYLGVIGAVTLAMGIALDLLLDRGWLPMPQPRFKLSEENPILGWIGTIAFFLLILLSARRRNAAGKTARWIERTTGVRLTRRAVMILAAGLVAAWWLLSGCFVVGPEERGVVTRFGAVTAGPLGPGLHYHWPRPFGRADRIEVGTIRRVEIGFRSAADSTAAGLAPAVQDEGGVQPGAAGVHGSPTESWMLTGDENILDLQCVVHFQVSDRPADVLRVLYQVHDPEGLVRATARWALQEAVGSQSIDSLLTVGRAPLERQVRDDLMQPALDACASGLRVVDVRLASVHAPTAVHWAFRDVAGAAEDAVQYVNIAREYAERVVREAMGDSARGVALARGGAVDRVAQATGEAASFELLNAEQRRAPALTKSRLRLEQLDRVLPKLRLYVDLTGGKGQGPDVWLRRGQGFETLPFGGLAPKGQTQREAPRSQEESK